ncbi:MAG: sulfatase-like hydrolase/transferase [Anaerolineales bacterium]|nr:sulfatase-like hydrolase/transferase [Anaerolineales bacterium]
MVLEEYPQKIASSYKDLWKRLIAITVIASFVYAFMEWIFVITSPSFMASGLSFIGFIDKLSMFFIAGLMISLFFIVLISFLFASNQVISNNIWKKICFDVAKLLPAFLLACLLFLLVDNFTYTVMNFGVVTTLGRRRVIYTILLLVMMVVFFVFIDRTIKHSTNENSSQNNWIMHLALGLMIISSFFAIVGLSNVIRILSEARSLRSSLPIDRPHIILLGSDGLNADHMSLFGYERDTSPKLRELADESLVAENAFANATTSLGSITSMLTGKLPATTRVLYRPDILVGLDAWQHLPGILKNQGYKTVEISFPFYADAYEANIKGGFDMVNNRSQANDPIRQLSWLLGGDYSAFFMSTIFERISSRLLHVFFIETMRDTYGSVTTLPGEMVGDQQRIDQLLNLFDNAESPLFVHVHMMGTHGPNFNPREQVFSLGISQDEAFMIDFYDDAILDFDNYVREIVDYLTENGILDETILVIYSDHGMKYTTNDRLPLLIRFPDGRFAGRLRNNVQNLDLPVTILDYMELPIPTWMVGNSLLDGDPSPFRFIYSSAPAYVNISEEKIGDQTVELWSLDMEEIAPPFFQFGREDVVICHRWYRLNLVGKIWESGEIYGHTRPCEESSIPATDEVHSELLRHLSVNGFDISSLEVMQAASPP